MLPQRQVAGGNQPQPMAVTGDFACMFVAKDGNLMFLGSPWFTSKQSIFIRRETPKYYYFSRGRVTTGKTKFLNICSSDTYSMGAISDMGNVYT